MIMSDQWSCWSKHNSFAPPWSSCVRYWWAMKICSLERTEWMMVRWMCGVSLKVRKRSVDLYSILGIKSVADVVRCGSVRWFGHLEHRSVNYWVSTCRNVEMAGVKGRSRKTWRECAKDDMRELGLQPEWAVFRDKWRDFICANV